MLHPELFETKEIDFNLSVEDLKKGKLRISEEGMEKNCTLKIPVIGDEAAFVRNIYDTWLKVEL